MYRFAVIRGCCNKHEHTYHLLGVVFMNRMIADIFASIISFMHVVVIVLLGGATFYFFSENTRKIDPLLSQFGLSRDAFIFVVIGLWIVYVLVVGFLSTIIAMNQNLERLVSAVDRLSEKADK